jgi:drug/metabolite transporter (DMT)-like permease
MSHNRIGLGIAARLGAVMTMGSMVILVKLCAERGAHPMEIIFFRNAVAFVPLILYILATGGFGVLRTKRPVGHLVRSSIGVIGMVFGFTALKYLPVTEFTAIQFAAPILIAALSGPVLKEKVGRHRWIAIGVGFCGVLFMLRPDPSHMVGIGSILALGQVMGTAGAMLAVRQLGSTEAGPTISFYFFLTATIVGALSLPFVWTTPDPHTLVLLVGCGLFGGVGQLLLTQAFRLAPASLVAPFDYATLLWNGGLAFLIWGELPRPATLVGGVIVVGSGLFLVWRELRRAKTVAL